MNKIVVVIAFVLGLLGGLFVYQLYLWGYSLPMSITASPTTTTATTTTTISTSSHVVRLEITYAYASWDENNNQWTITLKVKNTGPSDAIIDKVFINGRRIGSYVSVMAMEPSLPYTLEPGKETVFKIMIRHGEFMHGQTIEVKLHTNQGKEYPKQVTLP